MEFRNTLKRVTVISRATGKYVINYQLYTDRLNPLILESMQAIFNESYMQIREVC